MSPKKSTRKCSALCVILILLSTFTSAQLDFDDAELIDNSSSPSNQQTSISKEEEAEFSDFSTSSEPEKEQVEGKSVEGGGEKRQRLLHESSSEGLLGKSHDGDHEAAAAESFHGAEVEPVVAFSYARGYPSRTGLISYEKELTNVNAYFEPNQGYFLCRIPGLYLVTFNLLSPASESFRAVLKLNNHDLLHAYGETEGHQSASQTTVLLLQPGDRLYLLLERGAVYESGQLERSYTSFSGVLLKALPVNRNGFTTRFGGAFATSTGVLGGTRFSNPSGVFGSAVGTGFGHLGGNADGGFHHDEQAFPRSLNGATPGGGIRHQAALDADGTHGDAEPSAVVLRGGKLDGASSSAIIKRGPRGNVLARKRSLAMTALDQGLSSSQAINNAFTSGFSSFPGGPIISDRLRSSSASSSGGSFGRPASLLVTQRREQLSGKQDGEGFPIKQDVLEALGFNGSSKDDK